MKVAAIIQARMGSSRLPGKILKEVLGKPLLAFQMERVQRVARLDDIVVATTDCLRDDAVVSFCKANKLSYFRGSEEDVLKRYYDAALHLKADVVVRMTSDCPLIDPSLINKVIQTHFLHHHRLQYTSNIIVRTLPRGMDTEVFTFDALKEAYENAENKKDREHVTRYILHHPSIFKLFNVPNEKDYSDHRWTVDTEEDFHFIKKILGTLYPHKPKFTMKDIINLLGKHPEWKLINSQIQQKND